MTSKNEAPWYAAYPTPRAREADSISRQQLLQLFKDGKEPGKDFALIDLRRTDFEVCYRNLHIKPWAQLIFITQGGTIRGSINLPAQSLYPTIPALYVLFATAQVSWVIWYCGTCFLSS